VYRIPSACGRRACMHFEKPAVVIDDLACQCRVALTALHTGWADSRQCIIHQNKPSIRLSFALLHIRSVYVKGGENRRGAEACLGDSSPFACDSARVVTGQADDTRNNQRGQDMKFDKAAP
jgi:hypothetical protein